jgi:hypothetical protein
VEERDRDRVVLKSEKTFYYKINFKVLNVEPSLWAGMYDSRRP